MWKGTASFFKKVVVLGWQLWFSFGKPKGVQKREAVNIQMWVTFTLSQLFLCLCNLVTVCSIGKHMWGYFPPPGDTFFSTIQYEEWDISLCLIKPPLPSLFLIEVLTSFHFLGEVCENLFTWLTNKKTPTLCRCLDLLSLWEAGRCALPLLNSFTHSTGKSGFNWCYAPEECVLY